MKSNILSRLRRVFFPRVSKKLNAEFDRINLDATLIISLIGVPIGTFGITSILLWRNPLDHLPYSLYSVVYCFLSSLLSAIASSAMRRRPRVSHPGRSFLLYVELFMLIAWGTTLSFMHYSYGEQIITFYIVISIVTTFLALKPYVGIPVVVFSFTGFYMILVAFDGASQIVVLNYFAFCILCAAGSVMRYHLTLRHLREKAEIDRLNAQLRQDVQSMQLEVTKKELELSRTKIRLMQNQISPHFIFNALGIIKSLIWEDREKAADSVNDFSVYLRRNIEALRSGEMILFQKELEHIKAFLAIEMADETVELQVEYDIHETAFFLPPLTVEPLVENAVIHGVSCYDHGARIRISSRTEGACYVVEVSDNGRGFDTAKPTGGVGIENVRTRLEGQCGGRMDITSTENGTTALIYIPKRGEHHKRTGT